MLMNFDLKLLKENLYWQWNWLSFNDCFSIILTVETYLEYILEIDIEIAPQIHSIIARK